jgi:rare lipoprotein A
LSVFKKYIQRQASNSNAFDKGHMKYKILSSLSVTLLATIGTATSGYAQQNRAVDQGFAKSPELNQVTASETAITSTKPTAKPSEVVKVGEMRSSRNTAQPEGVIARIQAYESQGRQVATLYVRSIPVLTFLGSTSGTAQPTKVGQMDTDSHNRYLTADKTASNQQAAENALVSGQANGVETSLSNNDPVWQASAVAAKLNQLNRNNLSASAIAVRWLPESKSYSIRVNNQELVQINNKTILADTTKNPAKDALQATNRLRRLIGNAPPLREIAGMPVARRAATQVALGSLRTIASGMASWYGPGFNGNQSASGEIFNQNAMTAAHKTLPFGTRVQVTNLDNGRSVVVRINDRGPYAHGRVIDLSAAAARILGVMQSGVAPVRLEIVGNAGSVATY